MIKIQNLTAGYGKTIVLSHINLELKNETYGIIGPNGSGKTTLFRVLTNSLKLKSGHISKINGVCGYLPQKFGCMPLLTVKEQLQYFCYLKKIPVAEENEEICRVLRAVHMSELADVKCKKLSGGMVRRVGIAQALLGNPPVLILDEPTVGLDPKQIIEIRNLIKSLGRNHTIILSSHILPEVQAVCERVIVMNNGCLVADGATDTLAHDLSAEHRIIARIDGPESEILQAIRGMEHIVEVYSLGEKEKGVFEISIEGEPNYDLRRNLFALLTRKGWPLLALRNTDLTLEEVFLQLTSGDASHAAPAEPEVEVETEPENTEASEPEEAETKEDAEK